jgi:hypothetical protein
MNVRLNRAFEKTEQDRLRILDLVSSVPAERYFYQRGNHWSIAHILTHLLISEQMSLQYMKKKSLGIHTLDNSGVLEEFKTILLKISQRLPLKFKAPKIVVEKTPPALSFHDLTLRWSECRKELHGFLLSLDDKNARKKIYKHPVVGRLDAAQAVLFFREHVNHHLPQIKRLL